MDAESYGEEKVYLTAETGTIDQKSSTIHLEKDVVITSERGNPDDDRFAGLEPQRRSGQNKDDVRITDKDMTMTGTGMEAHPAMKTAQIDQDATVTMDTEPTLEVTSTVTITSDGPMEIDQNKSYAVFEDKRRCRAGRPDLEGRPAGKFISMKVKRELKI